MPQGFYIFDGLISGVLIKDDKFQHRVSYAVIQKKNIKN